VAGVQALATSSQGTLQAHVLQCSTIHREYPGTHQVGRSGLDHSWVFLPHLQRLTGLVGQLSDMSQFLPAAWAIHPDLIPNKVVCAMREPVKPFIEGQPLLFIRASELIHAKRDTLGFCALVKILEIHDFSPLADSSDDGTSCGSSDSSGGDGLPGSRGKGSLHPWLVIYRFVGGPSPSEQPWPSLSHHGGDWVEPCHCAGWKSCSSPLASQ
jgi:hypothetical protein